jgi:hypothetical protein
MTTKPAIDSTRLSRAEADQRDRTGDDAGEERDRELDEVPGDAAPSEKARTSLETGALARGKQRGPDDRQS